MKKRAFIPALTLVALCAAMMFIPSVDPVVHDDAETVVARAVSTDDSLVTKTGLMEYGTQRLEVELPDGSRHAAVNELRAQMELDKKFSVGDSVVVVKGEDPLVAKDHFRAVHIAVFFLLFAALLIVIGGWTGVKALFSFVFCCVAVWKVLVPLTLEGFNASCTAFVTVLLLSAVIMYLVAGATRLGLSAFLGSMLGIAVSLLAGRLCVWIMHLNGATMPYSQALLYSGYESLDLADIFNGAIILASSGAVMDLAMDIAAGVGEVSRHNPSLTGRQLFVSGLRIGRAVVGTMATTLLLAYSGGYLTMLMVFAAQGTHPLSFLNSPVVAAEIVKTFVGSFGLVLVAPFTAMISATLMKK